MKKIVYVIAAIALMGCSTKHSQSLKEIHSIGDKGKEIEAELDRGNARSEKILNSKG